MDIKQKYITLAEWQEIYSYLDKGMITREELARVLIRKWGYEQGRKMMDMLVLGR